MFGCFAKCALGSEGAEKEEKKVTHRRGVNRRNAEKRRKIRKQSKKTRFRDPQGRESSA
jgi:hypothetical protein